MGNVRGVRGHVCNLQSVSRSVCRDLSAHHVPPRGRGTPKCNIHLTPPLDATLYRVPALNMYPLAWASLSLSLSGYVYLRRYRRLASLRSPLSGSVRLCCMPHHAQQSGGAKAWWTSKSVPGQCCNLAGLL